MAMALAARPPASAPFVLPADTYYTPQRVEGLLRRLPDLPLPRVPRNPDEYCPPALEGRNPEEDGICELADIERALKAAGWFVRAILVASYAYNRTDASIARSQGCSRETVREIRLAGPTALAQHLGYRAPAPRAAGCEA